MTVGLTIDGALALLLVVTIVYCAAVHRRLGAIRTAQDDMRALAEQLAAASERAATGLGQLRAAAKDAADGLEPRIKSARTLVSDLDMLCHRAGKLADKLDRAEPPRRAAPAPRGPRRSETEHALIAALKARL